MPTTVWTLDPAIETTVLSGLNFVDEWDASSGAFPTARPGGGIILEKDAWLVSVAGARNDGRRDFRGGGQAWSGPACRAFNRRRHRCNASGGAATRLAVWYVPSDWRFLACAAVWICVGVDAIRRHLATTGALMIASGLCYAGAEMLAAPAKFGNPALVGADVFWWAGLAGVVLHGGVSGVGSRGGMGAADPRRGILAGRGVLALAKEAGR